MSSQRLARITGAFYALNIVIGIVGLTWQRQGHPWKLMPPAVCQARTVPIVCPLELISGIGVPPSGSFTVSQDARMAIANSMPQI